MAPEAAETEHSQKEHPRSAPVEYSLVGEYPPRPTRREFMISWTGMAWGTFAVSQAVHLAAIGRFMFPNVFFEPPQVFKAGRPEDYEWDKPSETYKQKYGTWMVKLSKDVIENRKVMIALSTVCTHLGCTPNVLYGEQKIKCPCHGSGFRFSGINFEGPAPRPLERWRITTDPVDGQIVVDKNKKFQYEKDEWTLPESYIPL